MIITVLVIILIIGFIASGILLLKQSAKKFHLSDEQLQSIKKREIEQKKEDDAD